MNSNTSIDVPRFEAWASAYGTALSPTPTRLTCSPPQPTGCGSGSRGLTCVTTTAENDHRRQNVRTYYEREANSGQRRWLRGWQQLVCSKECLHCVYVQSCPTSMRGQFSARRPASAQPCNQCEIDDHNEHPRNDYAVDAATHMREYRAVLMPGILRNNSTVFGHCLQLAWTHSELATSVAGNVCKNGTTFQSLPSSASYRLVSGQAFQFVAARISSTRVVWFSNSRFSSWVAATA